MALNHQIYDFFRYNNDLLRLFAFQPFLHFCRRHHLFLYLFISKIEWKIDFDPHLTIDGVLFQKDRIVKARGGDDKFSQRLQETIEKVMERRKFGFIGVPYINILELNLALDELQANHE